MRASEYILQHINRTEIPCCGTSSLFIPQSHHVFKGKSAIYGKYDLLGWYFNVNPPPLSFFDIYLLFKSHSIFFTMHRVEN